MNERRNKGDSVTEGLPAPRFALIRADGLVVADYWSAKAAADDAKVFWPDQEQDPDRTGKGWDVQVVGS